MSFDYQPLGLGNRRPGPGEAKQAIRLILVTLALGTILAFLTKGCR